MVVDRNAAINNRVWRIFSLVISCGDLSIKCGGTVDGRMARKKFML